MTAKKVVVPVEELEVVNPEIVDITQDAPLFEDPLKEEVKETKSIGTKGIKLGSRQGFGNDLGSQLNLVADIAKDLFHEGKISIEVKDGKQTVYLLK